MFDDIDIIRSYIEELREKRKILTQQREEKQEQIKVAKQELDLYNKSLLLLDHYTVGFLKTITKEYANLIETALKSLSIDYDFRIEFDTERKKPACRFLIRSQNQKAWLDPSNSRGEGIIDIIGLSAFLVTLKLLGNINFIALDEPLVNLHQYSERMANFLESFSKTGVQLLIVTQDEKLFGNGKVFKFSRLKGK